MRTLLFSALVMIPFYWLCLCSHIFVVSGLCLDDQRSLLLQLKNNFTFIHGADRISSKLNSWNASDDCCRWMGVTCDKEGHVTALDLSGESISGGFDNSSSLFSLQHLQNLNLAANCFNSSEIPSGFNKLENLTYLNLSEARFVGKVPMEISQLTRLVTLDLSRLPWFIIGEEQELEILSLQKLVQNLTSLRQLYLDNIIISAARHEWCSALLSMRDLQELSMSSCNLSGPLDPSLARLENLSVIVLDDNDLSSPVPETFAYFTNLTILSLVDCGLTGTFRQKIFNIGTLFLVDISQNYNIHGFIPDFPLSGSLRTLRLSDTNFAGALPHSIGNMRYLSELDLGESGFYGTIPSSLSNLTKLRVLDLVYNSFTGSIPLSLFTLSSLQQLYLSGNEFSQLDEVVNTTSSKLKFLHIADNNLSGRIPPSLFTLPLVQEVNLLDNQFSQLNEIRNVSSLFSLHLSGNYLFGRIPPSIFRVGSIYLSDNQFSQLDEIINNVSSSRLDTLDLSNNNISGPFPTSIFELTALSFLHLSSNKFSGSVQLNKFLEIKSLTRLDLSYNNLSVDVNVTNDDPSSFPNFVSLKLASCNLKTFPGFLRNLYAIEELDISSNNIQGTVPNWIWLTHNLAALNISHNMFTDFEGPFQISHPSNLYTLDFHDNKLQGPIPVFPAEATYLDFSSNKFSSFIPRDIGNYMSRTSFLSLSNNSLHGSIPNSLCNASSLQVLDLSMNEISGFIPSCLMNMSYTLEVLNLKNNNLSGHIPDAVPISCALWTLNLHGNLLDGPIPNSLSYCSKLEVLDLGSNQIVGGFPCFLKEISTLAVLVLRNNKFQGFIRCSKTNKTWEMLQIVDIAFNNFSGRLPEKDFTTWKKYLKHDEQDNTSNFIEKGFSGNAYYQDRVTVVSKGEEMELVKILTIFTSIDFSSNHFEGPIPKELMDFKELYILNLSNNYLSGEIPSSIGNLRKVESLDLSKNSLGGQIPMQLASLSFLSYLNLSFNHFVGRIPTGAQIQTFSASSFEGNDGLYGPPLIENPNGKEPRVLSQPECRRFSCTIDWNFVSVELGLIFGHGIVFGPLLIWKRWREWYWKLTHKVLCWIFPQMYVEYVTKRGQIYATLRWQR